MAAKRLTVGERIRRWRVRNKKTQAEVASVVGVAQAYLSQVERGERRVGIDLASRLAKLIGCEPSRLIQFSSPPRRTPSARHASPSSSPPNDVA